MNHPELPVRPSMDDATGRLNDLLAELLQRTRQEQADLTEIGEELTHVRAQVLNRAGALGKVAEDMSNLRRHLSELAELPRRTVAELLAAAAVKPSKPPRPSPAKIVQAPAAARNGRDDDEGILEVVPG